MKRWPWVSRANAREERRVNDLEAERRITRDREALLVRQADVAEMRYAALLEKYHALKVVGATPPVIPVIIPAEPVAPKPLSPIAQVIREQTSGGGRHDHALASHLWTYANQLKAGGKTEDEIVGALVEWQTSEAIEVE
jgi:hypothetical protein